MEINLKKLIPILGVACLSMAQVSAVSSQPMTAAPTSTQRDASSAASAVNPATYKGDETNVFVSVDYTLWTSRQGGMAYASSNYYDGGVSGGVAGSVYYPTWNLNSGFKVGLGAYLDHDGWDLCAEYTWFYNRGNGLQNAGFVEGLGVNTWFREYPFDSYSIDSASANFNTWFNRIDAQLGRDMYVGHYVALRPFLGLLGAWDNQSNEMVYNPYTTIETQVQWYNAQNWWGIGPYTGVGATFVLVSDESNLWSLFLDSGTSLMWSKYNASQNLTLNDGLVVANYGNVYWDVAPMIEMALGLRWETWWSDSWEFLLQAAWEEQVYFDHNHMLEMGNENAGGYGNFTMQGLTIKALLAF